ncbi:hypothetical protein [Alkalicoccobacillus plakortidis]|uniref:BhlA-like holin n=1 Tax=Alkalicoccobacillus plakortidis TaxID=444060 RepID=A0ABT0XQ58_9BACI|nr:hypothetical protein [Alkalicoccobacillus plakortidis]MCM2678047.1 hypothetical protein [Alkalicoccobacillus plakortidis]
MESLILIIIGIAVFTLLIIVLIKAGKASEDGMKAIDKAREDRQALKNTIDEISSTQTQMLEEVKLIRKGLVQEDHQE